MAHHPLSNPPQAPRLVAWPLGDDRPLPPEPSRGEVHGAALVLAIEARTGQVGEGV
ncbi:MAG: hypothetical protein VKQ33_09480 [Candidatus Sericytochromatia bacterium]|nr:hypothetical protein [Candidatus Sericytochromatia bacterium]